MMRFSKSSVYIRGEMRHTANREDLVRSPRFEGYEDDCER